MGVDVDEAGRQDPAGRIDLSYAASFDAARRHDRRAVHGYVAA